jgi:hypothetical protein
MRFRKFLRDSLKLYVDMDGVLTDFDGSFRKATGRIPDEFEKKEGKEAFWDRVEKEGLEFWSEMPWTKDGKNLWKSLKPHKLVILSSPSRSKHCREGKKSWVKRELGDVRLILIKDKHKYAEKNAVLIDDNKGKIQNWENAGGAGILFKSSAQALRELREKTHGEHV